jgi:hypothetical protein
MNHESLYRPLTKDDTSYVWETNFDESLIGFANRDEHNTRENTTIPHNALAIGEDLGRLYNDPAVVLSRPLGMANNTVIPPVMVLDVQPVSAVVRTVAGNERLDEKIWNTYHRDLNYINRVYNLQFDPIDLQITYLWLEDTVAHVANIMRFFDSSQMTTNINNVALDRSMLMEMLDMGWGSSEPSGAYNLRGLVDMLNTDVLGPLNELYWSWDFVPGMYRRAALFSKIFKDSDDPSNYAGLYILRPTHIYKPEVNKEGVWKLKRVPIPSNIWEYVRLVRDNIAFMLNDDSFRNIQTTMEAIVRKDRTLENGVEISKCNFDYYPYFGRPLEVEYNPSMLLAIHNATITGYNTVISDIDQIIGEDDEPNRLIQTFKVAATGSEDYTNVDGKVHRRLLQGRRVLDMPAAWTPDDWQMVIAATQFTTMLFAEQSETDTEMTPKVLGTEIISAAYIKYPTYPEGSISPTIASLYYDGQITFAPDGNVGALEQKAKTAGAVSSFAYAPLCALVFAPTATDWDAMFADPQIEGYLGDAQHLSFLDFRSLEPIKEHWVWNYLGYPLQPPKTGSFEGFTMLGQSLANAQPSYTSQAPSQGSDASSPAKGKSSRRTRAKAGNGAKKPKFEADDSKDDGDAGSTM